MVAGNWVFEIWHEDTRLIEQTFTTYQPDKDEIAALGLPGNSENAESVEQ